jgi:hypothetical protein
MKAVSAEALRRTKLHKLFGFDLIYLRYPTCWERSITLKEVRLGPDWAASRATFQRARSLLITFVHSKLLGCGISPNEPIVSALMPKTRRDVSATSLISTLLVTLQSLQMHGPCAFTDPLVSHRPERRLRKYSARSKSSASSISTDSGLDIFNGCTTSP